MPVDLLLYAVQRGIKLAEGQYIAFLDADDAWLPEKLEKQLAAMHQSNCLAGSTNAWRVREGENDSLYFLRPIHEQLTFHDLLVTNLVICSSVVVHSSILRTTGDFPETPTLKAGKITLFALGCHTNQLRYLPVTYPLHRHARLEHSPPQRLHIRKTGDVGYSGKKHG